MFQSQGDRLEAAGVILWRRAGDGRPEFLLLETARGGHYSPPKGHLDPGETFEEAALRETEEECGLAPERLAPGFREAIEYDVEKKDGRVRRKLVVYFLGEAPPGSVTLSHEHLSAVWAPLAEVERLVAYETLRGVFRKAAAYLERAAA